MKLDPKEARQILRQCDFGALATQSAKLPGYPFVSHVPLAMDGAGRPLMLLSRLAEHTRNLAGDSSASLMVSVPGPDPQAQPRLTLMGKLVACELALPTQDRYLRYHPDAAAFLGFGDFHFYLFQAQRIRLVGGFARAGWIEPEDWAGQALSEGEEAEMIARLKAVTPPGWEILGVDRDGLDGRTPSGRQRLMWPDTPVSVEDLLQRATRALVDAA